MNSPVQMSLDYLRKRGYIACVVEQMIRYPDKANPGKTIAFRRDAFNFGDILAGSPAAGVLLVQTTTRAHQAERTSKIGRIPEAAKWLESGGKIEVHGWAKVGPRGKRKTWEVTVTIPKIGEVEEFSPSESEEPEFSLT